MMTTERKAASLVVVGSKVSAKHPCRACEIRGGRGISAQINLRGHEDAEVRRITWQAIMHI